MLSSYFLSGLSLFGNFGFILDWSLIVSILSISRRKVHLLILFEKFLTSEKVIKYEFLFAT